MGFSSLSSSGLASHNALSYDWRMGAKKAVLFDLGNTLVQYYNRRQFPGILRQAIAEVEACLRENALVCPAEEAIWQNVQAENYEAADHRVRPLAQRLAHIFELESISLSPALVDALCRRFLQPIFACAQVYKDTLPTLAKLRAHGIKTAIVSNTPWGSPGYLWREKLARLGLDGAVDATVFCTDVGWRKPARPILAHALAMLGAQPEECLFVGDDPRWDLVGPRALGMEALLLARESGSFPGEQVISGLRELWAKLEQ